MLTIWRLEKERYQDEAFRGKGSLEIAGRWHHAGTQVAYASEHPALAILEKLVWLGRYNVARASSYVLVPLQIEESRNVKEGSRSSLPDRWDAYPHPNATRDLGSTWANKEKTAVLAVPSTVLPTSKNFLMNPCHPDFHELERGERVPFSWDSRLFGTEPCNGNLA